MVVRPIAPKSMSACGLMSERNRRTSQNGQETKQHKKRAFLAIQLPYTFSFFPANKPEGLLSTLQLTTHPYTS